MKQTHIRLIYTGFIILALLATNPSIEDHREGVKKMYKQKVTEMNKDKKGDLAIQIGTGIGMLIGDGFIDKLVSRSNYYLFSLTTTSFGDKLQNIGFGIMGQVFIQDKFDLKSEVNNPIIGTTFKIGALEIAEKNFSSTMTWEKAKEACSELGFGWRLPTIQELELIYQNQIILKDLINSSKNKNDQYWSSEYLGDNAFFNCYEAKVFYYNSGTEDAQCISADNVNVRAVRSIF